jgi:hypothetical protein
MLTSGVNPRRLCPGPWTTSVAAGAEPIAIFAPLAMSPIPGGSKRFPIALVSLAGQSADEAAATARLMSVTPAMLLVPEEAVDTLQLLGRVSGAVGVAVESDGVAADAIEMTEVVLALARAPEGDNA